MDAHLSTNQNSSNYSGPPPVLIAADSESAKARARATVAMAGFRASEATGLAETARRIGQQVAASALWLELDSDPGPTLEELLNAIASDVAHNRYPAIIAAPKDLIERLGRHVFDPNIDVVVGRDDHDRAAALAVAVSGARLFPRASDVTADKNAARLRQLSDEVSRIAATLARLSTGPGASARPIEPERRSDVPEVSIETVRSIIRARRLRSRYFPEELFADPAWDMLLDLLQAEIAKLRVPVSSLCIAAAVPATTALRWLKTMTQEGLFVRRADPHDGRRVFVELAPHTSQALRRYFAEVDQVAVV